MLRYHVLWFAFNSGCQSASILIISILICYYNLMKTSFHYMIDNKYIHMTNSCYKFPGSAIKRLDGLANTSCGFNGFESFFRRKVWLSLQFHHTPKFTCFKCSATKLVKLLQVSLNCQAKESILSKKIMLKF